MLAIGFMPKVSLQLFLVQLQTCSSCLCQLQQEEQIEVFYTVFVTVLDLKYVFFLLIYNSFILNCRYTSSDSFLKV